ncbi:M14 family zinc carboxypeptidase [Halalkalibacter urbisdiaboli]|uniref:M14 family zinc carboxypeptidase n=1 Tax=Halalkalibacter urbisdiaboli TaxID=1960589 RepID=UPI0013FDBB3A|nr:M14 family zinc carboxypeptidase [Halalkalibacter urbisdiaboli]
MGQTFWRVTFSLVFLLLIVTVYAEASQAASIVNPKQTYTYEMMERDMKKLANSYPDLIEYKSIGKSEYGREIYAIKLGNGLSTSYINGSNHAREWISTNLIMHMIDQYAVAYSNGKMIGSYHPKSLLDQHSIWFVPMMNPDGVTLQQKGLQAFPKEDHAALLKMNNNSTNFKRWKANGKGVDLNRQFDANWKNIENNPGKPSFANFKGYAPHTASEVKAVIKFTKEIKPEMAVSYHSSGRILFWNFHQKGAQLERDYKHAKAMNQMTGYRLMPQAGPRAGGGYTDWFIQTYKRPAFTPELGYYAGATNVPLSEYDAIWNQNRLVGLYIARESHKLFENRLRATRTPVSLVVNDTDFKTASGAFTYQSRTVVPVRSIFEELGANVRWNSKTRSVEIRTNEQFISLPVHRNEVFVNDKRQELDVPALLFEGTTYVPLRFIVETIGANVQWIQAERKVIVTYRPVVEDEPVVEPDLIEEEPAPAVEEETQIIEQQETVGEGMEPEPALIE